MDNIKKTDSFTNNQKKKEDHKKVIKFNLILFN